MSEVSEILFAIAGLLAIKYSIDIYCCMNINSKKAIKTIMECIVICTTCVLLAIWLK